MAAGWSVDLGDHAEVIVPNPGGELVAVGSLEGTALVVDVASGQVYAKLEDHPMGVLAAARSAGGDHLAVGGQDGKVHIYGRDGSSAATVALKGWVTSLAWSPQGLLAVGSGKDLTVVRADGTVVQQYPDQNSTVTAVAWSADGRRAGAAAYGGINWNEPSAERRGGDGGADDGSRDSGGSGGDPVRRLEWKGSLLALAVSPTGKWACGGAQDATVHIWRLWSGNELSMSGYPSKIEHLGFSDDGRWLAVGCLGELTMWDFDGSGPSGTMPSHGEAHERHISSLDWEPGGRRVATGGADGRVVEWPTPAGRRRKKGVELKPLATYEADTPVAGLAWVANAGPLIVGRADGRVHRLDRAGDSAS
jgi:WD40 repeat protein